jgi:hypothetical protein
VAWRRPLEEEGLNTPTRIAFVLLVGGGLIDWLMPLKSLGIWFMVAALGICLSEFIKETE